MGNVLKKQKIVTLGCEKIFSYINLKKLDVKPLLIALKVETSE